MFPWSFISLTSLHQLFFKPIRIFAVDINCYLDLISTNYMVSAHTSYPWYYDIRGNEWQVAFIKFLLEMNLVRKEKMMKWVFQTIAKDCDWNIRNKCILYNSIFNSIVWFRLEKIIQTKTCVSTLLLRPYILLIANFKEHQVQRMIFVLLIN